MLRLKPKHPFRLHWASTPFYAGFLPKGGLLIMQQQSTFLDLRLAKDMLRCS